MKKRLALLALLGAAVLLLAAPGLAMANMAIHGGYTEDDDACAGCHRAHTSASGVTWTDNQGASGRSALLASQADLMYEFCYGCHDASAQGADTNVQEGIYEGTLYGSQDATLLGGGFEDIGADGHTITSEHMYNGAAWEAYGGGIWGARAVGATGMAGNIGGTVQDIVMDCASCHDPHGSTNYRLLKDAVYGNRVGGYTAGGVPTPWVSSLETGYPAGGFDLQTEYPLYEPNYTSARYSKAATTADDPIPGHLKGMSGWCAGCHATYIEKTGLYNANDDNWLQTRHRHPVNVPLSNFKGAVSLVVTDNVLPLAHALTESGGNGTANDLEDWVDCLTCHYAHGTSAEMTGWANVATGDTTSDLFAPNSGGVTPRTRGVAPNHNSSLLRKDNRGVCQACHNK